MKMAKSQGFCEWCTELFSIELQNQRYIWHACNLNYIENNTKVKKTVQQIVEKKRGHTMWSQPS